MFVLLFFSFCGGYAWIILATLIRHVDRITAVNFNDHFPHFDAFDRRGRSSYRHGIQGDSAFPDEDREGGYVRNNRHVGTKDTPGADREEERRQTRGAPGAFRKVNSETGSRAESLAETGTEGRDHSIWDMMGDSDSIDTPSYVMEKFTCTSDSFLSGTDSVSPRIANTQEAGGTPEGVDTARAGGWVRGIEGRGETGGELERREGCATLSEANHVQTSCERRGPEAFSEEGNNTSPGLDGGANGRAMVYPATPETAAVVNNNAPAGRTATRIVRTPATGEEGGERIQVTHKGYTVLNVHIDVWIYETPRIRGTHG